jgi:hypothetical protein
MKVFFFMLSAALLVACSNSSTVPGDIIPSQKMGIIIWQLMQSDEYVNKQLYKDSVKKTSTEKMKIYQQVFDLNGTSVNEFKKSYQFYMAHPDITRVMFDSISARAGRQRADMYKSKPAVVKIKPDTLTTKPAAISIKPDTGKIKSVVIKVKPDTATSKSKKSKSKRPKKPGKKS